MFDALSLDIADQLMLGIPSDAISVNGTTVDTERALAVLADLHRRQRIRSARSSASQVHTLWMAGVRRTLLRSCRQVATVESIGRDEFYCHHYQQNSPVFIQNIAHSVEDTFRWSFDDIRRAFGDIIVRVQRERADLAEDPKYQGRSVAIKLESFIDEVVNGSSRDVYMTPAGGAIDGRLREALDEFHPLREIIDTGWSPGNCVMWMGPAGALTGLHYDLANVMIIPLIGRKRILLISPDEQRFVYQANGRPLSGANMMAPDYTLFPLLRFATPREVTVVPGSALFVPVGWWHAVESLDPTFSITARGFFATNDFGAPCHMD